jgi:hypothetical protein
MSVPRHHAEWLSLVEAQGAFLSIEELLKVFPQGLDAHEPEHFNLLKIAYDEWEYEKNNPEIHRAWISWVLENSLEFPTELLYSPQQIAPNLTVNVAQYGESLSPDVVLVEPDTGKPQLVVQIVSFTQGLEKSYKNSRWTASPATRMLELLRGTNIGLGLLTNGEQWMLVYAPQAQSSSFISWYSHLWVEEKVTLRAFRSLLGVRRFFAVEGSETLTALFQNSKNSQKEVTDQLGKQVLKAVEVLVQKIDKLDQDRGLLKDVSEATLYESALVVIMRLVFLFYAGVAEGKPAEEWHPISADELLALNICDFCMGSAAFLVQACRYLGEKLVQAWATAESNNPGQVVIAPEGKLSRSRPEECMIPLDGSERLIYAKRTVAKRCLYGVDKNHLAVEMAKLSLWLETMQKDKPFTFLDHCLKTGDSLIGVNLEQLKSWNLDTTEGTNLNIGVDLLWEEVQGTIEQRLQIQSRPVNSPQDQQEKTYLLAQANARIKDLKDRADLLMAVYHSGLNKTEQE